MRLVFMFIGFFVVAYFLAYGFIAFLDKKQLNRIKQSQPKSKPTENISDMENTENE